MRRLPLLLAAPSLLLAAVPASAATPTKISVAMTAAAEVPGPGKGSGTAELTFDEDKGQVCYMLMASGTDTPTMAHIHKGSPTEAGPVVVPLEAPANGMSQGCAPVSPEILSGIVQDPASYYVNVHTAAFPKGAMRAQLGK